MSHITVQICGGLGNQMFQYAMGRALSLRHHVPLILDISWFSSPMTGSTKREFLLNVFPYISSSEVVSYYNRYDTQKWKRIRRRILSYFSLPNQVVQPHFAYWPEVKFINPPAYLSGYWQSEKFFSSYAEDIRKDFTFPNLPGGPATFLAQEIKNTPNSVALHIRRGDYISNAHTQSCHGNIEYNYYIKALNTIKNRYGKLKIFIFSDEPEWVKNNFDCCGHSAAVIDLRCPHFPHYEMHLMSLCKHHIIANSTFSWWGAWLGKESGITIAPYKWFALEPFDKYKDIYCNNWIIL